MKTKNFLPALEKSVTINVAAYHYIMTGHIPSLRSFYRVHVAKLIQQIMDQFQVLPSDISRNDTYHKSWDAYRFNSAVCHLTGSITLSLNHHRDDVELYYDHTTDKETLQKIETLIKGLIKDSHESKRIGLIVQESSGNLDIRYFDVANFEHNIDDLYNDDFAAFNELILAKLGKDTTNGLVLLHGIPGTGKSSYLRYLTGKIEKNFIYMPSNMTYTLGQPHLISLLSRNKNSVLIIEDSEEALAQRKGGSNNAIATLLNLTDGLMADCLKIQVIATFNAELRKIDPALLRKGRIIGRYDFKPLSVDKTNALLRKQGSDFVSAAPMTLADIFNCSSQDFSGINSLTEIGFPVQQNGQANLKH
jgi:hypothetical protein